MSTNELYDVQLLHPCICWRFLACWQPPGKTGQACKIEQHNQLLTGRAHFFDFGRGFLLTMVHKRVSIHARRLDCCIGEIMERGQHKYLINSRVMSKAQASCPGILYKTQLLKLISQQFGHHGPRIESQKCGSSSARERLFARVSTESIPDRRQSLVPGIYREQQMHDWRAKLLLDRFSGILLLAGWSKRAGYPDDVHDQTQIRV